MEEQTNLNEVLPQRMYFIVLYNLSPIQQGIQSLHAVVDYEQIYGDTPEYQRWAQKDKTVVILTGGGSPILLECIKRLDELKVKNCIFNEPDLYGGITAVCFLADERVWDREKYPDSLPPLEPIKYSGGINIVPAIHRVFDFDAFRLSIGETNFQLREFIFKTKLRLA